MGGYGFLFRSEIFFRTTRELEYLFFSPELNIRLYDKNSESHFFFPPPKSEYFFHQHWESEHFFRKKTITPPFKLNGRSLIYLNDVIGCQALFEAHEDHLRYKGYVGMPQKIGSICIPI